MALTPLPLFHISSPLPYAISLGIGLTSASWFTFGNLGNIAHGCSILTCNDRQREKGGLGIEESVRVWAWFYDRAAVHFAPASAITALSFLSASYFIPKPLTTDTKLIRNVLWAGSVVWLGIAPWTLVVMLPTNKSLLSMRDQLDPSSKGKSTISIGGTPLSITQKDQAKALLRDWWWKHLVRTSMGVVGWVVALGLIGTI